MRFDAITNALSGNEGAYASPLPAALNALCGYVDLGWFAALLGWTLVLLMWWNISRQDAVPAWRWLPWSAAAGLAMALIALFDLTQARLGSSIREAYLLGDRVMTFIFLATVSAWWMQFGRDAGRGVRIACYIAAVPPLILYGWFISFPVRLATYLPLVGWLMVALSLGASIPWCFMRSADRWSRGVMLLLVLAPLVSSVGPLSRRFLFMSERFSGLTPLGGCSAVLQALTAFLALGILLRRAWIAQPVDSRRALWREARPFLGGALACVGLGLFSAWWIGERQIVGARERALDQAGLAATQINPEIIAAMLQPAFRLDRIQPQARPAYPPTRLAYSEFLAAGGDAAAKQALLQIGRASRTMMHLRFVTLRDGWLVGMAGYTAPFAGSLANYFGGTSLDPMIPAGKWSSGYVLLARQATAEDLLAWSRKTEWLEGPLYTPVFSSMAVFARAPVTTDGGRMLGWLEFTYISDAFMAGAVQARAAPLLGSILGVMLTVLWFVQRREARRRESALVEAAAAAAANRLKTEFLAKVSHELRTPLQSILGYGQMVGRHVASAAGQAHLAAQQQHGELMLRLVNDLLDLTAIEAGGFRLVEKPMDLAQTVAAAVDSLRVRAEEKGLHLACQLDIDRPAWVIGDEQRLRQIVLNLTGNAVKFTEHGKVSVTLARLEAGAAGDLFAVTVADTGPGITPADQARLFQPFSRLETSSAHDGAGLGLALTSALCHRAGGTLTVSSAGPGGATFCATFRAQPCAAPDASDRQPFDSLQGCRILVADDNRLVRELFTAYLTEAGANCEQAVDGRQALARAATGNFDAMVLDLAMPHLNGFEVVRHLRATGQTQLLVVGVSAHASSADQASARAAGMDACLAKPVKLSELSAALSRRVIPLPMDRAARMHSQLEKLFLAEAPSQASAVAEALVRRDWVLFKERVRYPNSTPQKQRGCRGR